MAKHDELPLYANFGCVCGKDFCKTEMLFHRQLTKIDPADLREFLVEAQARFEQAKAELNATSVVMQMLKGVAERKGEVVQ